MATFSLEDLRNEVSKKYAPTIIENGSDQYILQNILQLPAKKRKAVMELVDEIQESDQEMDEQIETFREVIVAAEANDKGPELLDLIGDNMAMIVELTTRWMEATQMGEAEGS